jgi:hypothetical protein
MKEITFPLKLAYARAGGGGVGESTFVKSALEHPEIGDARKQTLHISTTRRSNK